MLDHVPDPADSPSYAYWCERSTYASEDRDEPDCFARCSAATPEPAIQRIRDEARALLAVLPEAERPVVGWAEGVGRVRALGALHGGAYLRVLVAARGRVERVGRTAVPGAARRSGGPVGRAVHGRCAVRRVCALYAGLLRRPPDSRSQRSRR